MTGERVTAYIFFFYDVIKCDVTSRVQLEGAAVMWGILNKLQLEET